MKNPLFTVDERVEMLKESTRQLGNVAVATFEGLMVDFARQNGATAVLRGIRAITDYEYEFQMALMNRRLAPEIETVFLQPAGRYSFVSSRLVKEVVSRFRLAAPLVEALNSPLLGLVEKKRRPLFGLPGRPSSSGRA